MASSSRPLPSDIIFKILTRTSLETLDTCKAVKKEWHDMIFESSFMPLIVKISQDILSRVSEFVSMDGCSGNGTTTQFHLPRPDELPYAPAVHVAGLIYFQLCHGQVMALNYDGEEVFPRLSLPNCPGIDDKYNDGHRLINEYKGKLGCTCLSPNEIMLWVFDNGRQDWELIIKEVDIEIIKGEAKYAIPHGFYNADIALMAEGSRVFFYKLQDKNFNLVTLKCHSIGKFFPFRSDLEPMDIRMPRATIISSTKHLYRPSWISFVIVFLFLFGTFLLFSHA
ncbi:hypothetical protein H5410_008852 [Solanum commersonii]|uniref:F-box domain-containing protein n=1 Tax=Solanum commersonii TaxID=4109 RepID=A0A9J6AHT5_SOLCO|nr:hypothetical protein H5410_008852 [Solanum commersonii]